MICKEPRCDIPATIRGLCRLHYQRLMRTGNTHGHDRYNHEGHKGKGLGVVVCMFCDKPVRDHNIGPCPVAGVRQFRAGAGIVAMSKERQEYQRKNHR